MPDVFLKTLIEIHAVSSRPVHRLVILQLGIRNFFRLNKSYPGSFSPLSPRHFAQIGSIFLLFFSIPLKNSRPKHSKQVTLPHFVHVPPSVIENSLPQTWQIQGTIFSSVISKALKFHLQYNAALQRREVSLRVRLQALVMALLVC